MRRFIAMMLAVAMMTSYMNLSVFAEDSTNTPTPDAVGDLTTTIRLDYPELLENTKHRAFVLELSDGIESYLIELNRPVDQIIVDGHTVDVSVSLRNEFDVELTTEQKVGYYEVVFSGLPNNRNYHLSLIANGYRPYSSSRSSGPIEIKDYSRKILIGAHEGGFAIGDINGDHSIDAFDLEQVRNALGSSEEASDLNRDGKVDIEELALVHNNQFAKGEPVLYDTALIVGATINQSETEEELKNANGEIQGNIEDLFVKNDQTVTLKPANEGQEVAIPITFTKPQEMEQIQITSPVGSGAVEGGVAVVEYEDENGDLQTLPPIRFDNAQPEGVLAISREAGKSTVVIDLGKRVAVKKVTIKVEKVQGDAGYTVVENIEFLKDVVPDNSQITNSIPQNVVATAGSESVSLTWKPVNNVDGYTVRYGTKSGNYNHELKVTEPKAEIVGLDNLKPYYFVVLARTEDGWTGKPSMEVSATPQPSKVPPAPDFVTLQPQDQALSISWKETKDALSYNVYYKKATDPDSAYQKAGSTEQTSFVLGKLENGTEYHVVITAVNNIGEGPRSLPQSAIPEKQEIAGPELPTEGRIPNSEIQSIKMTFPQNVAMDQYPNGFDVKNVADGDYSTHWTARRFWESKEFIFEFKEPQDMNYLIYVPRLDSNHRGSYASSLNRYMINVWDSNGHKYNLTKDGGDWRKAPSVKNNPKETKFAILPFEHHSDIKRISVEVNQWDGSPTEISLSEIVFYEYNGIEERVDKLFANSSKTQISKTATQEEINALRTAVSETPDYYIDSQILLDEIQLAEELLKGNTSALGVVHNGIQSRNTEGDLRILNTLQPLGVVAPAGEQVVIYAEGIPEGETVSLVPTQYYAEASSWKGAGIPLENGRNVITIPSLISINTQKGGSLYLEYDGASADQIKLQVRGTVTKIPTLELYNWDALSEQQRKEKINTYTNELKAYVAGLGNTNLQTNIYNATEISLPYVLLSLPADQTLSGLSTGDTEQALYQNTLAWNQLMELMYRTHGIDDITTEASRNNIRYQRMFAGAFMYAAGSHIGVEYGSTAPLVQGRPAESSSNPGALFGWGIAHEIGHNLDTLGHAEITNNIYSLFAQTYDNENNTQASRLEPIYPKIFDKTSSGAKGLANDVFVQLGMYWQLHLAYDGANDNFYNLVNKAYRDGVGSNFSGDERFAVVASQVSGYDLTEFFTQWGVELSESAKQQMASGKTESRKIHYLSDESRRQRLAGAEKATGTVDIAVTANEKDVTISIDSSMNGKIQGYEILKNGKPFAFVTELSDPVFTESIGSMNNKTITYQVNAIDILGNVAATSESQEIKIQHNNEISRDNWTASTQEDGSMLIEFKSPETVSGIVFKNMPVFETPSEPEQGEKPEEEKPEDTEIPEAPETNPDEELPEDNGQTPQEPQAPQEPALPEEPSEGVTEDSEDTTLPEEDPAETPGTEAPEVPAEETQPEQETGAISPVAWRMMDRSLIMPLSTAVQEPVPTEDETVPDTPEQTEPNNEDSVDQDEIETTPPAELPEETPVEPESPEGTQPATEEDTGDVQPPVDTEPPVNTEPPVGTEPQPPVEEDKEPEETPAGPESPEAGNPEEEQPDEELPNEEQPEKVPQAQQPAPEQGKVVIEVSKDGTSFTPALTIDLNEVDLTKPENALQLFNGGSDDGRVLISEDIRTIRITGLPSNVTAENFDFAGYPGDNIEFMEGGIGRLATDYRFGPDTDDVIPAGTLIVAGTYRGDPVYSTVRVVGEFFSGAVDQGETTVQERPMNGDVYLFAEVPEAGQLAEINNGIWIFVPDIQAEEEIQGEQCTTSILPGRIKAELYRTDDPNNADSKRLTSNTKWISSPSDESMPDITLKGEE